MLLVMLDQFDAIPEPIVLTLFPSELAELDADSKDVVNLSVLTAVLLVLVANVDKDLVAVFIVVVFFFLAVVLVSVAVVLDFVALLVLYIAS
jgi:hypothetical protein